MDLNEREILYRQFQETFPVEFLKTMPIERYTNLDKEDSFCYWIESKTYHLGSVWGGTSYKFGIYKYNNLPKEEDPRIQYDDTYAWYRKFKKDTAQEAYELVRSTIVQIAQYAQEGNFKAIDKITTLGESYKWKIAFLYSNEKLVPIYKHEKLTTIAILKGMHNAKSKKVSEIQQYLMQIKGDENLYKFSDELWILANKYDDEHSKKDGIDSDSIPAEDNKEETNDRQYWWLVANANIWSLMGMKVGEEQNYTLYNDEGHKRRIFKNFLSAKEGDVVFGYESTPTKQIVAMLTISKPSDGVSLHFKKTRTLNEPIDFSTLKAIPALSNMEYMKNQQGSFFKVTEDEYDIIIELIRENNPTPQQSHSQKYSKEDFLNEVYVLPKDYQNMVNLLMRKKNLILQGAPGVGKTFAAKRLAYAIMGEKDDSKVLQVQFHQSYSYEDFVMGYKPNEEGGFELKNGIFYRFCKRAAADREHKYFFIIDEINRGNLSKIFGELLMLIENDYRDTPIHLAYNNEEFSVPSNLYIIGMMNTADRSLAMIDYALRRRFSFFSMKPGFTNWNFKTYIEKLIDTRLDNLIKAIIELNKIIENDDSLGAGFCIGHSYFCNLKDSNNIEDIVEYDIIPMLREYWFDNDSLFNEESQKLRLALK